MGGVVVAVVVLDRAGFQISNCQKPGSVIGADSASVKNILIRFYSLKNKLMNSRQKSLPLDAPERKTKVWNRARIRCTSANRCQM